MLCARAATRGPVPGLHHAGHRNAVQDSPKKTAEVFCGRNKHWKMTFEHNPHLSSLPVNVVNSLHLPFISWEAKPAMADTMYLHCHLVKRMPSLDSGVNALE